MMAIMVLGLFAGCSSNYVYQEGDFSLEIEVDKTEAKIGDTITVTATFRNLTGKKLPVVFHDRYDRNRSKIEHIIHIALVGEDTDFEWAFTDEWFRPSRKTLQKDTILTTTKSYIIDSQVDHIACAIASFYVGSATSDKHFITENTGVGIESNQIKINVI